VCEEIASTLVVRELREEVVRHIRSESIVVDCGMGILDCVRGGDRRKAGRRQHLTYGSSKARFDREQGGLEQTLRLRLREGLRKFVGVNVVAVAIRMGKG
jgi:hypothetical protein